MEQGLGNPYSMPRNIAIDPDLPGPIPLTLERVIAPIPDPLATKYVKHERTRCNLLSEFRGRLMHLGAHVLLPEGFAEHSDARYPLVIYHGHHPETFGGFREATPDPGLEPDYGEWSRLAGYNGRVQEGAHPFYQEWIGPGYPRMILVEIQHASPFYVDPFAVNSAYLEP